MHTQQLSVSNITIVSTWLSGSRFIHYPVQNLLYTELSSTRTLKPHVWKIRNSIWKGNSWTAGRYFIYSSSFDLVFISVCLSWFYYICGVFSGNSWFGPNQIVFLKNINLVTKEYCFLCLLQNYKNS